MHSLVRWAEILNLLAGLGRSHSDGPSLHTDPDSQTQQLRNNRPSTDSPLPDTGLLHTVCFLRASSASTRDNECESCHFPQEFQFQTEFFLAQHRPTGLRKGKLPKELQFRTMCKPCVKVLS